MGAEDGRVSSEIIKTVSDNGNNDVQHDEGAEEDKGDEVDISDGGSTSLLGICHVQFSVLCIIPLVCP